MSFYTEFILQDPRLSTPNRVADPKLLEPETRARIEAVIEDARELGIELMHHETYRSRQRQAILHDRGATQLRQVGVHHYGLAGDVVKSIAGDPSWKGSFAFLGPLARKHGLIWGGDWKHFKDLVHLQRIAVADQARLFRGDWYPGPDYEPF